ncbi:hypothetical protein VULLAG_LOCUS20924 [Vulpes lagopus]
MSDHTNFLHLEHVQTPVERPPELILRFRAILGRVMPSSPCEKLCTWIPCMESFGNFPPVLFQMSGGTQRGVSL